MLAVPICNTRFQEGFFIEKSYHVKPWGTYKIVMSTLMPYFSNEHRVMRRPCSVSAPEIRVCMLSTIKFKAHCSQRAP